MKRSYIIVGVIITVIIVAIIATFIFINGKSTFDLKSNEDGSISITTKNAGEGSGGVGEVTLQEGQKLEIIAELEKENSINVKVISLNSEDNKETVLDEVFKQNEEREFELSSGNYRVIVTAEKGATGSMNINVK